MSNFKVFIKYYFINSNDSIQLVIKTINNALLSYTPLSNNTADLNMHFLFVH